MRLTSRGVARPDRYPHRSAWHPSVRDDFDVVMAIAAELKARGLAAEHASAVRYGTEADVQLLGAMVIERARAWKLLGALPLPRRGELATPVKGSIGGCGYFGCPRPGHLHNVDFLAPQGTAIHAADSGTVALLESPAGSGGYGNFICLQHRPHLAACYAHLVAVAATIKPGISRCAAAPQRARRARSTRWRCSVGRCRRRPFLRWWRSPTASRRPAARP